MRKLYYRVLDSLIANKAYPRRHRVIDIEYWIRERLNENGPRAIAS